MTHEAKDKALFDKIAYKYAKKDIVASSSTARKGILLEALHLVLNKKADSLGTIIEIGCGIGATARYLEGRYTTYLGVDLSDKMIENAILFNAGNPKASFAAKNAKSPDIPSDSADLILSVGALHHMTELDEVMRNIKRIARNGAYLVAIEPQRQNPAVQLLRKIRARLDRTYSADQAYFKGDELRNILSQNGITSLFIDYQGFFAPPFAQVIMYPSGLFACFSGLCVKIDRVLNKILPLFLRRLSFNIVVTAKIEK